MSLLYIETVNPISYPCNNTSAPCFLLLSKPGRFHISLRRFFCCIYFFFYYIYAEIVTRLTMDRVQRDLPPVPCQFCGGYHNEKYCPKAKEMGLS